MRELENKYIELLLKRCINFNNSKILFLSYMVENDFVLKVIKKAKELGVEEIHLSYDSLEKKQEILSIISLEDIDSHPFFNRKIWDDYALRGASFLMLQTEMPGLMDNIDDEKLSRARYIERASCPIFERLQSEFKIPWCIANIPNKLWAKDIFPNDNYENAYNKLFKCICSMCMVDTRNPIESWNDFLRKQDVVISKLNSFKIKSLHYNNSLGTDLILELDKDALWSSAGSLGENMFVNMPSYEVFTTPNMYKTNGIVYSSRPLMYNGGLIDNFYLEFKNGKVINFDAKVGRRLLEEIIKSDEFSSYLGEVALVNYDSPISNTGLIFKNTTIDENASCHLALGSGFSECIINGENMSDKELLLRGVNLSKNHVDFMVGTSDLSVEANTNDGNVLIMKKGNICI